MATLIIPRRTVGLLAAGVGLLAVVVLALIYLPKATITVHSAQHERTIEREVILAVATTEPNFASYTLPTRLVEAGASEERTVERTGATLTPDFARGQVTLINNRDEVQELLPKTHLKHEGSEVFFLTDSPVGIPAHGSARMNVTAEEKGEAGNVPAGKFTIDKLPADLQSDVYAESKTAFTGGVVVESPITAEEITKARNEALAAAVARAQGGLTAQAGGAHVRGELTQIVVSEEAISAGPGSRAKNFTVRLTVAAKAFVVNDNDLLSLTLLALRLPVGRRAGAPKADEEFISYRPESFRVNITRADFERGQAQVTGNLTGLFASKIGPAALDATALAGLSAQEVKEHFKGDAAVGSVDVAFSPFWVRSVPGRKGAVEIKVQN